MKERKQNENTSQPKGPAVIHGQIAIQWDIFLAFAHCDEPIATKLYTALTKKFHFRVFFSSKALYPGDLWDKEIPKALRASSLTAVVMSPEVTSPTTQEQYYMSEEIAAAIMLARRSQHRVIPIYFSKHPPEAPPYGLQRVKSIVSDIIDDISYELRRAILHLESAEAPPIPVVTASSVTPKELQEPAVRRPRRGKAGTQLSMDKLAGHVFLTASLPSQITRWRRKQRPATVLLIDLDQLTVINKRYGRHLGDAVLGRLGEILATCAADFKGRCGDDTFYAIFVGCSDQVALGLAVEVCDRVKTFQWGELAKGLHVTCSIGIAHLSMIEPPIDWPIRAAVGLKSAKENGGNQVFAGPLFLPRPDAPSTVSRDLRDHYS